MFQDRYGKLYTTEKEKDEGQAKTEALENAILSRAPEYVSLQKYRRTKTDNQKFIIEHILPEGELHILEGQSGIGKTTMLLPMLRAIELGEPIMGFKTTPTPFVYIMCDSTSTSLERKLRRVGLGDWDIPAYGLEDFGSRGKFPVTIIPYTLDILDLPVMFKWAKLFVIEAYSWFYKAKSPNATKDYSDTFHFWSMVRDAFSHKDLTILGTTHPAKQLEGKGYKSARERPLGSVGQGACTSTLMSLNRGATDDDRILHVAPRDYPEFDAEFLRDEEGRITFSKIAGDVKERIEEAQKETSSFQLLNARLLGYKGEELLHGSTVQQWAEGVGISSRTARRWVNKKLQDGELAPVQKGIWRVKKNIIYINK